ncbi:exported hypothetical protein [Candidatus Zixiibacteriota bacterium]|nr:exported hypothetical protein [candidate division Zixibacteria bacterium]
MKRYLAIMTAGILLLAPAAFAQKGQCCGQGMGMGKGMGMGMHQGRSGNGMGMMMFQGMADKLGLDDKQKDQIMKLQEDHRLAMIDKRAELEKAQVKLRSMMTNNAPDKDILAAMDKIGLMKTDIQKARFEHMRQVKAVLTPEQLKKWQEMKPGMKFDGPGNSSRRDFRRQMMKDSGEAPGVGMRNHPCNMQCLMFDNDGEDI